MYLIDTNIFIEILLDQEKADVCLQFLNQATEKEIQCIVTSDKHFKRVPDIRTYTPR